MEQVLQFFDNVWAWIALYGPTIAADIMVVVGAVASIRKNNLLTADIRKENANLKRENAELKEELRGAVKQSLEYSKETKDSTLRQEQMVNHLYRRRK